MPTVYWNLGTPQNRGTRSGVITNIADNADDAMDLVDDQFALTQNWATTMLNQTLTFLNAMNTIEGYDVPTLVLDSTLPTDLDIPEFTAVPPGELNLSYTTPARPSYTITPLDGIFLFAGVDYSSLLGEDIVAKLRADMASGGTGLGAAIEDAIWQRARSRKEEKDVEMYTEAENYFAARGWNLPPGMLSGRLADITREISKADDDINYEIMIKQAEIADQNTRHNKEVSVQFEGILRDYYIRNELKNLEVSKAEAAALVEEFNTKIRGVELDVAVYQADLQGMIALIDAQVRSYLGQVEAYRARAAAYQSVVEAQSTVFTARAAVVKTEADIKIAELNAQVNTFLGIAELEAKIAESAARISAQIAAGAMSAVNAGVSFNYGASESASVGFSDSDSYSESVSSQVLSYEGSE